LAAAAYSPTPRVRVSAALRWDGVDDSGFAQSASGDSSAAAWSPRAGVVVYANEARTISVFGQVSRAFKMPTLDQLFDVRPFPDLAGGTITISNAALKPQRATNLEAGISGGTRVSWSAVAYRMDVTDEIDFDVRTFSYGNIGRSEHTGFEFDIESRAWSRVRPQASYTLSRAVDDDSGAQLKNVPLHAIAIGANAELWWKVGLYARYSRRWGAYLDDENASRLDGPSRLDIRIRRPVGRHQVFLDLYNATNDHFEEYGYTLSDFTGRVVPYVYPGAGAAVRAGFTLSY
jgi:outer membrane cobalamin receptor